MKLLLASLLASATLLAASPAVHAYVPGGPEISPPGVARAFRPPAPPGVRRAAKPPRPPGVRPRQVAPPGVPRGPAPARLPRPPRP